MLSFEHPREAGGGRALGPPAQEGAHFLGVLDKEAGRQPLDLPRERFERDRLEPDEPVGDLLLFGQHAPERRVRIGPAPVPGGVGGRECLGSTHGTRHSPIGPETRLGNA